MAEDFTLILREMCERALRISRFTATGETSSPNHVTIASNAMNSMIKRWQSKNIHLWEMEWITYPLSTASSEVVGSDGLNYKCIRGHTASSSNKPVTGTDWSTYWLQTGSSGSTWVDATAYTCIADFEINTDYLSIEKSFIRYSNTDYPVSLIDKNKFFEVSDKTITGMPNLLFLEKLTTRKIHLLPQPDIETYVLHCYISKKLKDFDSLLDTPDRQNSIDAIVYGTASSLLDENTSDKIATEYKYYISNKARSYRKDMRKYEKEFVNNDFVKPCY